MFIIEVKNTIPDSSLRLGALSNVMIYSLVTICSNVFSDEMNSTIGYVLLSLSMLFDAAPGIYQIKILLCQI